MLVCPRCGERGCRVLYVHVPVLFLLAEAVHPGVPVSLLCTSPLPSIIAPLSRWQERACTMASPGGTTSTEASTAFLSAGIDTFKLYVPLLAALLAGVVVKCGHRWPWLDGLTK